eukprot:gene8203-8394_t
MQTQADLGSPAFPNAAAALAHATELVKLYSTSALPLYSGLDERERGPADELLWLAAAALMQAAALQQACQQQHVNGSRHDSCAVNSTKDNDCDAAGDIMGVSDHPMHYMVLALLVMEAAVKGRPYCAPVRLGLTGLHGLLGNAGAAAKHFTMLDVKHIQHDTISSHHLLPLLLGLKSGEQSQQLLSASAALVDDHLRDAADTLMQALKHGTHTKVLEFVCFKERLERSHSYVIARAEQALLSISSAAAAGSSAVEVMGFVVTVAGAAYNIKVPPGVPRQRLLRSLHHEQHLVQPLAAGQSAVGVISHHA